MNHKNNSLRQHNTFYKASRLTLLALLLLAHGQSLFSGGQNGELRPSLAQTLPMISPARANPVISILPKDAELHYSVTYGGLPAGTAALAWRQDSSHQYQMSLQLRPVIGPRLSYFSQGTMTAHGLRPDAFYAERSGKRREQAKFDHIANTIHFGKDLEKNEQLDLYAQDVLSVSFYLAQLGKKPPSQSFQVTTGKKTYRNQVRIKGDKALTLGAKKIPVFVLESRDPDGDKTEFWLAPDWHNLPLRIIRTDKGKTIDQRLSALKIDQQTVLAEK